MFINMGLSRALHINFTPNLERIEKLFIYLTNVNIIIIFTFVK